MLFSKSGIFFLLMKNQILQKAFDKSRLLPIEKIEIYTKKSEATALMKTINNKENVTY